MFVPFHRDIVALALAACCATAWGAPDAQALLSASDLARGGGLPGLVMLVRLHVQQSARADNEDADVLLRVKARDGASTAEVIEPLRSKGLRLLQVDRNMWIHKPGMKKPVAVSARQRLSGQAALGDIVTTGYTRDYVATYSRKETMDGEPCHVLDLTAARVNTTYDRITYWVAERSGFGMRADFLSVSGKLLKRADFRYEATLAHDGRSLPFVSRMTIQDALTAERTTLDYSAARAQSIPASEFDSGGFQ